MSPDGARPAASLADIIADLDEAAALARVQELVTAGVEPLAIIEDCQRGLQAVGERYQAKTYFISGLIMAGEIFREVMEMLGPRLQESRGNGPAGTVLLCTVRGDIHDLGKSIVDMLLRSHGFAVHDLGVDVTPAEVARCARELQPDIVGLSGLLTAAFSSMKETVAELRAAATELDHPLPVIIGGGPVTAQICRWAGADLWADDAVRGVRLIAESVAADRG
jgi:methanogenic corrinoid protein MtbC1